MKRLKLFLSNFIIYGIGGTISKIIPLIMVPIVTRLMPDTFTYGISDLSNTIISLFTQLAIMGMYDAMYRLFFEKDDLEYKKEICSSAFFYTFFASIFICILMISFQYPISKLFYTDSRFMYLVVLCAICVLFGSTNSIISAPTRMQNRRITYIAINTISPLISYGIAIPLIIKGYYYIALPLATLISAGCIEITFYILNREWFSIKKIRKCHIKPLLKIAIPLLPIFIIYWVFNSSDKVMITNILDSGQEGIYSVAAKIGHISQLIYVAFAGGWQYFSFSIMKDKDNRIVISRVFEVLTLISLFIGPLAEK